ncbi:unnamed protein product [Dibothriocephalus latus]|uniref:Uncharacterized protein n=1 Tax=Dibothriocephalus latus TaxID=60516 RepID=A0A3P7LLX4_DIBLA|nr:unnamed protein product [Dibothriocephalus latus]
MDGVERTGKVNKADGCRLLVTMAEFKDPSQSRNPALLGHVLESRTDWNRENNSEDLRSNVDEAYAAVIPTFCLITLLVDRHKDA